VSGPVSPGRDAEARGPKVLGVVGTLVWDTIHREGHPSGPTREWGGIGYALESLQASLPDDWEILPIIKVGHDLSEEAFRFLGRLERIRPGPGVQVVLDPNNRVELRYRGGVRVTERLTGGVSPWSWVELGELVSLCDALYVNFISGFEFDLETASVLRARYEGPIYADLHSLFLGVGREGDRVPRVLPHWARWLQCFDAVQMNEQEFHLLARREGDPWELAARVVGTELKLMTITLDARGAAYVASAGFDPDPFTWSRTRARVAVPGAARSGIVRQEDGEKDGDPTGCGDVWGSTTFARLLAGDTLEEAMSTANRMAARNVAYRGARGLGHHLAGRVVPDGGDR
jgi:hypothetical protein